MKKNLILIICSLVLLVSCSKDGGSIFGVASAAGGAVTSGITVKLYSEGANFLKDTQTDSEGNFKFSGLESGNYYIGATITVDGDIWDTGNRPKIVYVADDIDEEVTLNLTLK
jgi:hypothetical protein